jgi:hypothetical protein
MRKPCPEYGPKRHGRGGGGGRERGYHFNGSVMAYYLDYTKA